LAKRQEAIANQFVVRIIISLLLDVLHFLKTIAFRLPRSNLALI
jgi:hypothetical protein